MAVEVKRTGRTEGHVDDERAEKQEKKEVNEIGEKDAKSKRPFCAWHTCSEVVTIEANVRVIAPPLSLSLSLLVPFFRIRCNLTLGSF